MNKTRGTMLALAAVLLFGACADEGADADRGDATPNDTGAMEGMEMGGMESGAAGMMVDMQAHMQMMSAMSGDSMVSMLPTHRQMMANMIAQMDREMVDMNMSADDDWSATMDSLRTDLVTMAEMDPAQLQALMPGHHRRATRLMDMHREMMAGMQM